MTKCLSRLMKRDTISEEQCLDAITSQMPQEVKMRLAGQCIPNDGSLSELHSHVDMAYKGLKAVAGQHITRVWASRIGRE